MVNYREQEFKPRLLLQGIPAEVSFLQLDRCTVRRAVRRAVPGVVMLRERQCRGEAFFGDDALQRGKPVTVVGLAGIRVACCLSLLDLLAERRGPLAPTEYTFLLQRERHRERMRFPRRAKHRAVNVARDAGYRVGSATRGDGIDPRFFRRVQDRARTHRWRFLRWDRRPVPTIL